MKIVLDTSALLLGKPLPPNFEYYAPPKVMEEIEKKLGTCPMEIFVMVPEKEFMDKVVETAKKTGDYAKLSEADLEVIALALQLKACILTEDFSIQNVASLLGIKFYGDKEIKEIRRWVFRCTGCGRYFDDFVEICPYCGHEVKRTRRRKK